jgi:hypothetical protein
MQEKIQEIYGEFPRWRMFLFSLQKGNLFPARKSFISDIPRLFLKQYFIIFHEATDIIRLYEISPKLTINVYNHRLGVMDVKFPYSLETA